MNLIIDQGNTFLKVAIFENRKLISQNKFDYQSVSGFIEWCKQYQINHAIISSVVNFKLDLPFIKEQNIIKLNHATPLPINNNYNTPKTLGNDRIANVIGAWCINPNNTNLVIDAGTCIKYDLISSANEYLGGNISPGLIMRFKALNFYTDKLPLLKPDEKLTQIFGTDTNTSLQCGVILGVKEEVNGFINRYEKKFKQLTIFMTGGDLKYFDKTDKKHIFANKNLTLIGLNEILIYNA